MQASSSALRRSTRSQRLRQSASEAPRSSAPPAARRLGCFAELPPSVPASTSPHEETPAKKRRAEEEKERRREGEKRRRGEERREAERELQSCRPCATRPRSGAFCRLPEAPLQADHDGPQADANAQSGSSLLCNAESYVLILSVLRAAAVLRPGLRHWPLPPPPSPSLPSSASRGDGTTSTRDSDHSEACEARKRLLLMPRCRGVCRALSSRPPLHPSPLTPAWYSMAWPLAFACCCRSYLAVRSSDEGLSPLASI